MQPFIVRCPPGPGKVRVSITRPQAMLSNNQNVFFYLSPHSCPVILATVSKILHFTVSSVWADSYLLPFAQGKEGI